MLDLPDARPAVREHFAQEAGTRRYAGTMARVWRARGLRGLLAYPALRLSAAADLLFTETGEDVPFEMTHEVAGGRMTWTRVFRFPRATRRFHAVMRFDAQRGLIDDRLGAQGRLRVELLPEVRDGAVHLRSGRQSLRVGRLHLPLPRLLAGEARIREWERPDGALGVRVTIHHSILGEVFGYEGSFARVE